MNYTENYRGIKIDVQAPQINLTDNIQEDIRKAIDKLIRFTDRINAVDMYFNVDGQGATATNILGMRVGIPGPDVFAEERGGHWEAMLRAVTDKNVRQIQKK